MVIKVGIPESFKVRMVLPQKTGSSHLKLLYFYLVLLYCFKGMFFSDYYMIKYLRESVLSEIVMFGIAEIHLLVV